ncbi:MAG: TonB-dependent receptor [Acinetobacter sp.]|nr:TonB-dependent receptor [Acinetobacter sp.]
MRYSLLFLSICAIQTAYAQDIKTPTQLLPTIQVQANDIDAAPQKVKLVNEQHLPQTLGEALSKVSGVQNVAFTPASGSPMIRSLTGHRVQIVQDGTAFYGMNAISAGTNIPYDAALNQHITLNKSNDSVRFGGHAVGGSVQIENNVLPNTLKERAFSGEVVLSKGFNHADTQGIRLEVNDQKHFAASVLYSQQRMKDYRIPNQSKAAACQTDLFASNAYGIGVNSLLADLCQKNARVDTVFNIKSRPYYYPDYYDINTMTLTQKAEDYGIDDLKDIFKNSKPIWNKKLVANPLYVAGETENTQVYSSNDITENYDKILGNSDVQQQHFAVGTSYIFDQGYLGFAIDHYKSDYGLPGFTLKPINLDQSYRENLPVRIANSQSKYMLAGQWATPFNWAKQIQSTLAHTQSKASETLGRTADIAENEYDIDSQQFDLRTQHQWHKNLSGWFGISYQQHQLDGRGRLRYLPNVQQQRYAAFIQEQWQTPWLDVDVGYRNERVKYNVQETGVTATAHAHTAHTSNQTQFVLNRNSKNYPQLSDRQFNTQHYHMGTQFKWKDWFAFKLRYAVSERIPEINELYASNEHYSILTQAEGDQNLKPEHAQTWEATATLRHTKADLSATAYRMDFKDYIYLGHSGISSASHMPVKYWKQTDTLVQGFEIDANYRVDLKQWGELKLSAFADLVKNKAKQADDLRKQNDGEYLPNMPTHRYGYGLSWQNAGYHIGLDHTYYAKAKYLGRQVQAEVPLDAYHLMNIHLAKSHAWKNTQFKFFINGTNLLNADARQHNSPLRYIAPLPARAWQLGVNMNF